MAAESKERSQELKEEFLSGLKDLENRVSDTWVELDETRKKLNDDHIKLTEILNRYKNLNRDLKQLRNTYNDPNGDEIDLKPELEDTYDVGKRLKILDKEMSIFHENKLRVGSLWLRFLVGRVSMKIWDHAKKIQLKTEYHKFKGRTNWLFLCFPLIQLIWSRYYGSFSWLINQWHQMWLLYYYITLTTREVILKLNGSKMHEWWIIHHQISSFGAFISILLMRSVYDRYSFLFEMTIWMSLIVGLLQIYANKYQLKRHYVRLALGKDQEVDIALTESIVSERNTESSLEFNILKICCYVVYLLELALGLTSVFYVYWNDSTQNIPFDLFQFEAYLCGICFFLLGVGNTYALYTRPSKYMERSGSREKLYDSRSQMVNNERTFKKDK